MFTDMWGQVDNNKVVAALWPNDGDGNAWGDKKLGFPPALTKQGYKIVDPGRYQNGTEDFSSQISRFKAADAEIVTGVPIPPDWTTFWKQASQQGFRPKIASVGKALLFPASVEALGDIGDGMSTEVWWSPRHPFKSSLTGASWIAEQIGGVSYLEFLRQLQCLIQQVGRGVDIFEEVALLQLRGRERLAVVADGGLCARLGPGDDREGHRGPGQAAGVDGFRSLDPRRLAVLRG